MSSTLPITTYAAFPAVAAALYKFYHIKVPDGFETPSMFKFLQLYLKSISWIAKTCDRFGIADHPTTFKLFFKLLELKPTLNPENDTIQVRDVVVDNVLIRVYTPKTNDNGKLPVLIWYHGGAYVFGSIGINWVFLFLTTYFVYLNFFLFCKDGYHNLTKTFAKLLNFVVISIEYRLAPENKYPIPLNDCWTATNYIINHPEEFNIDLNKVVVAGDSAGGAITAVITNRLRANNPNLPKLQILIYPWLQHLNFYLPSYDYYGKNPAFTSIGTTGIRLVMWYLGETEKYLDFEAAIKSGKHLLLIEDKKKREEIVSYVEADQIPEHYQKAKKFYANASSFNKALINEELDDTHILKSNEKFNNFAKCLLSADISPGLVDDETLKRSPKTYLVVCELDSLKDECIIYSERLRKVGVPVELAYYETGYHGMIVAIKKNIYSNRNAMTMVNKIVDYIKANID